MAKKNQQAKKMASKGASVKQITKATGVSRGSAQKFTSRSSSGGGGRTSGASQAAMQAFAASNPNSRTAAAASGGGSSRTTPEQKGIGQGLRVAGENGISKSNFKDIAEAKGNNPEKIIHKLDKINTNLIEKGKAGIDLKSGAANMLIKKAQKSSDKYRGYRTPDFGEGAIGSALQSMISTPANAGTWIKGQLTGGREADPGFNPGGKADKNRMIGGTVLRPDGKIANKGVGEQYKLPKRFKGEDEVVEDNNEDTNGDGDGDGDEIINTGDDIITTGDEITEEEPVEEVDRSASSGAGGLDLASWATGFKKARSARQKSGPNAQGLASQKKNPFKSWA
jgi:hypothetical protein